MYLVKYTARGQQPHNVVITDTKEKAQRFISHCKSDVEEIVNWVESKRHSLSVKELAEGIKIFLDKHPDQKFASYYQRLYGAHSIVDRFRKRNIDHYWDFNWSFEQLPILK